MVIFKPPKNSEDRSFSERIASY